MKTFRDTAGTDWTVFEVRRNVTAKGDWSYLPKGYGDGWLCFESTTAKKRLTRFPENWRELNEAALEKLLAEAQAAPRTSVSLRDDLSGDTPPDVRPE
jgi:hypothetical protein